MSNEKPEWDSLEKTFPGYASLRLIEGPEKYAIWRHKKRGTSYQVVGYAAVQCAGPIKEGEPLVIYKSVEDGKLWARPVLEFNDGRFERWDGPKTLSDYAAALVLPEGFEAWVSFVNDDINIRGPDNSTVGTISRKVCEENLAQCEADKIVEAARELAK